MKTPALFLYTEIKSTQSCNQKALLPLHLEIVNGVSINHFISSNLLVPIDKLQRQMGSDDNVLRTKILIEINEDFHDGSKLNQAINPKYEGEGENEEELPTILNELVRCFEEEDNTIRELASRAIIKVASTEKGRNTLVDLEIVPMIKDLFNDE